MRGVLGFVARSSLTQILITLAVYALYASVIGISLFPSVYLVTFAARRFLAGEIAIDGLLLFCLFLGASLYVYFIAGIVVMGVVIRLLSAGMKPGRYPKGSFGMLRWLIYSGIYHIAGSTILNFIPMTFFTTLFFRLMGAKIGRNVYINSWNLNDAYLLEIEDDVVIGGKSDISCHTFEGGCLVLDPIRIGKGTLIGTRCYVSPGVVIGRECVIGMYSFIRKNTVIPDRTYICSLAGMRVSDAAALENLGARAHDLLREGAVKSAADNADG
jgi:acetyltransferase-like isoleucine patch superfamily enzyme